MATSPNYAWAEPDNSSLVKNGASDIRTLGDAIDTSVWNVGYGQAGKNKIINGDFSIWQRGTTQLATLAAPTYGSADRWAFSRNGTEATGTNTISRETFTVGQTDVPNNPTYYCRWTTTTLATSQTRIDVNQYVENVSSFAGQTVTLSFYVKSSGTFAISTFLEQNFGSGGSTTVTTTAGTGNTSTSWQRFTTTVAIPSITGKTVGASNYLRILIRVSSPTAGATFDFANAQLEYGSKATPFQTASGGSPQAELAMCQRYYEKSYPQSIAAGTASTTDNNISWNAVTTTSNRNYVYVPFKVIKRGAPTITVYSPITGTSGKLYNALTSAGDKNATANYIQDYGFSIYLGPTDGANAVGDLLLAQYVASAEL